MKNAELLGGANSNTPVTVSSAFNGKPSLSFATALYVIQDKLSRAFIPTSESFSIGAIFRKSTSGTANMIFRSPSGFQITHESGGQIRVRHDASIGSNAARTTGTYGFTNPVAVLYSYNGSLTQGRLYINGTLDGSNDAVAGSPTDNVLALTPIGEFFDLMVWNTALHDTANAATLGAFYPYATARYGI